LTAAVFRTLNGAKIYGNSIPRGGCADTREVSCTRPDRFGGVLGEDRLLKIRIEPGSVGELYPERIARRQRLPENDQPALPCRSFFNVSVHLLQGAFPIQPDRRDLREPYSNLGLIGGFHRLS
jgi:hypothetical protein